jgi:TPR repeat protein
MLLGQLLEQGRPGLRADPERALGLFSEACASELQQACDRLGH